MVALNALKLKESLGKQKKTPQNLTETKPPPQLYKRKKTSKVFPERLGFFIYKPHIFFANPRCSEHRFSENQTLLMTNVISSTKIIMMQASVAGFQLLDKPLQRYDPFS